MSCFHTFKILTLLVRNRLFLSVHNPLNPDTDQRLLTVGMWSHIFFFLSFFSFLFICVFVCVCFMRFVVVVFLHAFHVLRTFIESVQNLTNLKAGAKLST